jgi:hypothetical protein
MCNPAALIVLTAASAAMSYQGQVQQAEAQTEAANQNAAAAEEAYNRDMDIRAIRLKQESDATQQEMWVRNIQAEQARATIQTAAGGAGVHGQAVKNVTADFERQRANNNFALMESFRVKSLESQYGADADYANFLNRRNQMQPGTTPSILEPIIKTAAAGTQAYMSYYGKPPGFDADKSTIKIR